MPELSRECGPTSPCPDVSKGRNDPRVEPGDRRDQPPVDPGDQCDCAARDPGYSVSGTHGESLEIHDD